MRTTQHHQRGIGTLAVSMLLLFATSIVIFYLNRGLIFEQKTSANQYRSTLAFEAAEAGLEWATGMLNQPYDIQANCAFDTTTNISFRRKYVQTTYATSPNVVPATNVLPGCYIDTANNGALTCSCPNVPVSGTATASLTPSTALPGFTVSFAAVAGDAESVQVTSVGCNAATGACTAATSGASDATATVTAILKMRRILRAAPAAALTCGNTCNPGATGNFNVVNFDASVNGITVNSGAGTTADLSGPGAIGTVPGMPLENSIVANDSSLSTIRNSDPTCTNDAMFRAYFGSTISEYAASTSTTTVTNKTEFLARYADGWRSFYFPSGAPLQGGWSIPSVGTQADPVTIVVNGGDFTINSTIDVYGLVFSDNASAGSIGTGSAVIHGAMVACNDFNANGNGAVVYDGQALSNAQLNTATLVRVPGSWRDF